jgi:hypothetical protein
MAMLAVLNHDIQESRQMVFYPFGKNISELKFNFCPKYMELVVIKNFY